MFSAIKARLVAVPQISSRPISTLSTTAPILSGSVKIKALAAMVALDEIVKFSQVCPTRNSGFDDAALILDFAEHVGKATVMGPIRAQDIAMVSILGPS